MMRRLFRSIVLLKTHAEGKAESLDDQVRRLKAQVDDYERHNQDLNGLKARLTQENFELQRQVQDLDSTAGALSKSKLQLQAQLDDTKSKYDEEYRVCRIYCSVWCNIKYIFILCKSVIFWYSKRTHCLSKSTISK